MKSRDILLGLIVLVLLIAGVLWIRKARMDKALKLEVTPTPTTEEKISKSFNNLQVPDNIKKVELNDVAVPLSKNSNFISTDHVSSQLRLASLAFALIFFARVFERFALT